MNVFHTMEFLLKYSEAIREKVKSGEVEIQGAAAWLHLSFMASEVYHLETGKVDFLGLSPRQAELLSSKVGLPPSMSKTSAAPPEWCARRAHWCGCDCAGTGGLEDVEGGRLGRDGGLQPAFNGLWVHGQQLGLPGNERFAVGAPTHKIASASMRQALVSAGQQPHSAILGCADSRVPIDTVFDAAWPVSCA